MSKQQFSSFSKKQLLVLSWWHNSSCYKDYDGIICDGAIRSGKTTCMSLSFVMWAFYCFSDTSFALCGKTIASLKRNIISSLLPTLRELGFECKEKLSQNLIEITFGARTNRFYLFGGKDESSATLIQGMTLGGILLDEVALMPRSFCEQALARCSLKNSKYWFNCNPENPMHWFYEEWIKKCRDKNCLYLHFLMSDNPSLDKKVIARYENLYSGAFYERFVLGKWVAADGLVYPDVANGKYVVMPPVSKFSKCYVSCDYGTVNPTSMGLWGFYDNVWYRFAEFYFSSKKQGRQLTDEEYYTELESFTQQYDIAAVIVDPSAASFIECIRRHGRFKVQRAKNDVVSGIRKVHTAFKSGQIAISPVCKEALREFSLYRWDEGAAKDTPKKENDHAMDEIRYFVSTVLCDEQNDFFVISTTRSV